MVRSLLVRSLLVLVLFVVLPTGRAEYPSASTSKKDGKHTGPFSAFTKSLPQDKKKPFMELMKRLRGAKAATVGTKDEKKKVLGALDADIHKLLGPEYKRYRTVQHAQHEMHSALKKGASTTGTAPVTAPAAAPPPAAAADNPTKKKSRLPGLGKKKKASTTVG